MRRHQVGTRKPPEERIIATTECFDRNADAAGEPRAPHGLRRHDHRRDPGYRQFVCQPVAQASGSQTLTILTSDYGDTPGPAATDSDSVAIHIAAVADAEVSVSMGNDPGNDSATVSNELRLFSDGFE
jgi:hypothetical protein